MLDMMHKLVTAVRGWGKVVFKSKRFTNSYIYLFGHNGPATAAPVQELPRAPRLPLCHFCFIFPCLVLFTASPYWLKRRPVQRVLLYDE